ncbi:MAG: hypothetical protein BGP12_03010 [Rhodospirillales bacterium 70-18]|nr:MAG: hypothetical protein BGP12_03010 [Rhodospirillales bacterium 70-18]
MASNIETTAGAVIPSHGNGVLQPWQPGQSGNPGGRPNAVREALRLAREASPDAMRTLIAMMTDPSEDSRARIVAATHILDRAMGKPKEPPPDDKIDAPDISSAEARARIIERIERISAGLRDMDAEHADNPNNPNNLKRPMADK